MGSSVWDCGGVQSNALDRYSWKSTELTSLRASDTKISALLGRIQEVYSQRLAVWALERAFPPKVASHGGYIGDMLHARWPGTLGVPDLLAHLVLYPPKARPCRALGLRTRWVRWSCQPCVVRTCWGLGGFALLGEVGMCAAYDQLLEL